MSGSGLLAAVLVALGGGAGAMARYAIDRRVGAGAFPLGITIVNLSGSLLLGLVVGVLSGLPAGLGPAPQIAGLALSTGLLGGYTTLSAASLDTVRLAQQGRLGAAAGNAMGTLGVAVLLAAAGMWAGHTLVSAFAGSAA